MFTAALSTIAKTWKQHGMDKEDVVYIHTQWNTITQL